MDQYPLKDFYTYTLIVQQHYRLLYRYAVRVIPFKTEIDNIVAAVMLSMWDQRANLVTEESIRLFLKKRMRLQCSTWLHQKVTTRKTNN